MYFDESRQDLEQMFKEGWGKTTPVKWENTQLSPVPTDTYVAFTIREGKGRQVSLGNNPLIRFVGFVIIQVFIPKDSGTGQSKLLSTQVSGIYNRKSFTSKRKAGYYTFEIVYPIEQGANNGWYQINLMAPFTREVTAF
jgi:hypothetical protein